MSMSEQERARRRRESRRRAANRDVVALAVLVLAVVIAVVSVSCAVGNANGSEDSEPSRATKRTTTTTSASETTTTSESTTSTTTTTTTSGSTTTTTTTAKPSNGGEHYVQPAGGAWNLILVNDWNTMPQEMVDSIKLEVINNSVTNGSVDARIVEPLKRMVADCRKAGGNIWAQSMFRPYDTQKRLYNNEVARWVKKGYSQANAEVKAATIVKRPGQSEHNTGLAVDFNNCDSSFTGTVAYNWLIEHCAEYGFILRFPKGKEDITGVIFESWHYRYVGVEAATEIMRDGITLEEYCQRHGV